MSRYRRNYRPYSSYSSYCSPSQIEASLVWDTLTNAGYNLRFTFRGNEQWKIVEETINTIKKMVPSSQREYTPETKTWLIGEAMMKPVKDLLDAIPNIHVNFIEKPAEQTFSSKLYSRESDFEEFKRLLSMGHQTFEHRLDDPDILVKATKSFRRAAMSMHPDHNPDMANEFSSLNTIFTRLFKSEKKMEYENAPSTIP